MFISTFGGREMDKYEKLIISWMEAGTIQIPQLLLQKYRVLGLNENELVVLLQIIAFIEKGIEFPTPEQIAANMTISKDECILILSKLLQMEWIKIEEVPSEQMRYERYSLTPLWAKLAKELMNEKQQENMEEILQEEQNLYTLFEKEFGRPLSPIECETLAMWIDQDGHDPSLIKAALVEAVISGARNFRYIDRILFEWKKNGIQTVEEAREQSRRFRKRTTTQAQPTKKVNKVSLYNWLEQ